MKKKAPKLPRFRCPKDMKSKIIKSKKDKAKSRANLKRIYEKAHQDQDAEALGKISKLGIPLGLTFGGAISLKKEM